MKHILVRPFRQIPSEVEKAQESLNSVRGISFLDPETLTYPVTRILVAENGKPVMFLPVQTCYVLESLGPTKEASDMEIASALKQLTAILHYESSKAGHGEMLFFCGHPATQNFAEKHGWERVDIPIYRWKVSRSGEETPSEAIEQKGSNHEGLSTD